MSAETLRLWQRRAEVDVGQRRGVTTEAGEEIKRLKRENAELRRANEILKSASVVCAKELDRPKEMIRYIQQHKDQFEVEAICRVLRPAVSGFLTSRGYRAAISRPASARQLRDELLIPEVVRLHAENYGVYGRRRCMRCCVGRAGTSAAIRPNG